VRRSDHLRALVGLAHPGDVTQPPTASDTAAADAPGPSECPVTGHTGRPAGDVVGEARDFLHAFYGEAARSRALTRRWRVVQAQIERAGTYAHTRAELVWGTQVAWRQSARCVGRIRWRSLIVRDARTVIDAEGVYRELVSHLRYATNRGRIRPTITVFPADAAAGPRVRVWNEQLVRYAGYSGEDDALIGDPRQVGFTGLVQRMGWHPPAQRGRFDALPWVIETATEAPRLFPAPVAEILEVPIGHPDHPWLAGLGLRWHAVPVISHMRLRVGGVDYSCAPFNGWYVGDEIATRNLGDRDRYDALPAVARGLGLDLASGDGFWRQRACLELNVAVQRSFRAAGVTLSDALTESELFAQFAAREEAAGRPCYGDWSWINGHFAPALGAAFHRYYDPREPNPNFWLDPDAKSRAAGQATGPTLATLHTTTTTPTPVCTRVPAVEG
jgi:nitric-oxide synthase, bacterial